MLRFIDLADQICEGVPEFAWYDTVRDEFLGFCGEFTWSTWPEFLIDYGEDEQMQKQWPDVRRFHSLVPTDVQWQRWK